MTTTTKTAGSVTVITFPTVKGEVQPVLTRANTALVAIEAQDKVDNLENNWFGQSILAAAQAMAGKALATYEEAADFVSEDVETLKKEVMGLLQQREDDAKAKLRGDDLNDAMAKISKLRGKVDNSMRSAKSVLRNAVVKGETILSIIRDGGHILFRADGTPRGKSELQDLIKQAKAHGTAPKSAYEHAVHAGYTYVKKLCHDDLTDEDRKEIKALVDKALVDKLRELDADVEDTDPEELDEAA